MGPIRKNYFKKDKIFFSIRSKIFDISAFIKFSPVIFSYSSIYLSETVSMYSSLINGTS